MSFVSSVFQSVAQFRMSDYPPAEAVQEEPPISAKTWGSVAIVVGCVALGAIVGVAIVFGAAVTWPIWLPIVVGAGIGLGVGLVAMAFFRSQCTQEILHPLVADTQELRNTRAGWNNIETVMEGMLNNDHWRIVERGHRANRVTVPEDLQRENHKIGRGMAKKVYGINKDFVWLRPLPGREDVFDGELEEVRVIRQGIIGANPGLGENPTDEQMCLALDVRCVEIPGHSARAVAKRYLGDLRDVFNEVNRIGEVTPEDILQVITDMRTGLGYLHSAGFTHGDISPQNVFIYRDDTDRLRAVIADFGQTRSVNDGDAVLHGDWSYSSPEQRRHRPSDVYGVGLLGVRLLDHLVGRRVAHGNTVEEHYPVRDRSCSAFTKTAFRRGAGVFGFIAHRPEAQIHQHIDGLVDGRISADLRETLKNMTRDNPQERAVMEVIPAAG